MLTAAVFPIDEPAHWRRALAALARNFPVTRYGVYVSPDGGVAGVVFGNLELKLDPFPRHEHAGATLRLRGEVNHRFDRASVHVTGTDGRVEQRRFPARRIEIDVRLATPGSYRVEVMGDGAMGPTLLANVPLYVDVAEPELDMKPETSDSAGAPRTPEEAQARMLALLNEGRRAAGVAAHQAQRFEAGPFHQQELVHGQVAGEEAPLPHQSNRSKTVPAALQTWVSPIDAKTTK